MDMNTTIPDSANMTSSTLVPMAMLPFHTAIGLDMLWFAPWMPSSAAATFGTCVGLFFLGGFYRFLFAVRAIAAFNWVKKNDPDPSCCDEPQSPSGKQPSSSLDLTELPRFSWRSDVARGLFEGLFSFVGYFLMLAVMLMNAWFFIAIILGIIVGETAFGRFGFAARSPVMHRGC